MLSPLTFAIVVDALMEDAREGLLNEILYTDGLLLIGANPEDLRERFQRWRIALEGKRLKLSETKDNDEWYRR